MAEPSTLLSEILAGGGLSFAQAGRKIPAMRGEQSTSPSTCWRWHTAGVKLPDGSVVRLEALKLAGRFLTSLQAIQRFVQAQNISRTDANDCMEETSTLPNLRTAGKRQKDSERATEQLKKVGF